MKKIYLLFAAFLITLSLSASVIYVSPEGSGTDGTSWSTAMTTIRGALDIANSGDEIWVKQGTYTLNTASDVLYYVSGVDVYGGFAGTETTLDARSNDASLTQVVRNDSCTASFRLLTGVAADDESIWDGFTFSNGYKIGGAGVLLRSNNTLQNCIVESCENFSCDSAYASGGGVYMVCDEYIAAKMVDCKISKNKLRVNLTSNSIRPGGGGVYVAAGSGAAIIDNCVISGNTIQAESDYGAICTSGAGIFMYAGNVTNTEISNNKVIHTLNKTGLNSLNGSGICIRPTEEENVVNITDCTIEGNYTNTGRGGAVVIDPTYSGSAYTGTYTFENCIIKNNYAQTVGGGIFITSASALADGGFTTNFVNCIIANNTADAGSGGGTFFNAPGATVTMTNCNVVANFTGSKYAGGGVYLNQSGCIYTLSNCLIWGNSFERQDSRAYGTYSQIVMKSGNTTNVIACAIEDADSVNYQDATVAENITLSRLNDGDDTNEKYVRFVNPADTYGVDGNADGSADWHLTSTSDCIDWGTDVSLTTDIEGNSRPVDGSGLGDAYYDIGAYEYNPSSNIKEGTTVEKEALDLYGIDGKIMLTLEQEAQVEVFNVAGQKVNSFVGVQGLNEISVDKGGLYIVRSGQKVAKTIVF